MNNLHINWEKTPEWAQYAAKDKSGAVYVYESEPHQWDAYWYCRGKSKRIYNSTVSDDWRSSLTERPKMNLNNKTIKVDPEILKALNRKIAELEAELEQYKPKPKVTDGLVSFEGFNYSPYMVCRNWAEYRGYGVYLLSAFDWQIVTDSDNAQVLICRKKS